jgi:pseudouridine synthase
MILTNDGELADRLMHPRFGFERTYHARVEGAIPESALAKLERGIKLADGPVSAKSEIVSSDDKSTWVEVRISEGRNRVVRRIFDKLGYPVMKLRRTVYGPFKLGRLQVGQLRVLTEKEYADVRRKVFSGKNAVAADGGESSRRVRGGATVAAEGVKGRERGSRALRGELDKTPIKGKIRGDFREKAKRPTKRRRVR